MASTTNTYRSGDEEGQGAGRLGVWWRARVLVWRWPASCWVLMMAGVREESEAPLYKGTNSTTRAPPLWPNHLPEAPPPKIPTKWKMLTTSWPQTRSPPDLQVSRDGQLTPVTSPHYLTITQSENLQELILYPKSPLPHLTFKNAQGSRFLSTSCPRFLVQCLILNAAFSFTTTPGVNRLALLWEAKRTQVWHSNIKS